MIKFVDEIIESFKEWYQICPAEIVLLEYAVGISLVLLPVACCTLLAFFGALVGIAAYGRHIQKWLLPLLLGAMLCLLHEKAPWDIYRRQLPRQDCSATIRGTMLAYRGQLNRKWSCDFKISALGLYNGEMQPSGGHILAYFSDDVPYRYGAECTLEGGFLGFNEPFFRNYNQSLGINGCYSAYMVRDMEQPSGWLRCAIAKLFQLRKTLAEKLTEHIEDEDAAGIYQAMIFGIRGGLRPDIRSSFIKSSTIHLFSISGLHIGLMSITLGVLARLLFLPYRLRLPAICLTLFFYVLLSGGAPSALRAWLMILLVIISQNCYRVHSSENTLSLAGLILLISNPMYLKHTGFLFSFLLVYVLLKAGRFCKSAIDIWCEKRRWLPRKSWLSLAVRSQGTVAAAMLGSITAWLGCNGIMMYATNMLSFGSILINSIIGPIAFLLVAAAFPKIAISYLCQPLSILFGRLLNWILNILLMAAEAASAEGFYATGVQVPLWYSLAYSGLLWLVLSRLNLPWCKYTSLSLLLAMAFIYPCLGQRDAYLLAYSSDSGGDACIACCDAPHHAWIVQPGTRDAARRMLRELQRCGHADKIDVMLSSTGGAPVARYIMRNRQGRLCCAPAIAGNRRVEALLVDARHNGWNTYSLPPVLPIKIRRISPGEEELLFKGKIITIRCGMNQEAIRLQ